MFIRKKVMGLFATVILLGSGGAITGLFLFGSALREHAQGQVPDLTLTVTPEKTQPLLGEPLKVRLTVRNNTSKEIIGIFPLAYRYDSIQVDISPDGGQTIQVYTSPIMRWARTVLMAPPPPVTLQPQGTIEGEVFISFNVETNGLAFPKTGKFWFRMKVGVLVDLWKPTEKVELLESGWIAIEVLEPTQDQDKKAFQFIQEKKLERFLTPEAPFAVEKGDDQNEIVRQLKALLEKFPNSTYAPYAKLGLEAMCKWREQELPACQEVKGA